jgi:hypothetical protein
MAENPRTKKIEQRKENDTHEVGERAANAIKREDKVGSRTIKDRASAAQRKVKKTKKDKG